MTFRNRTWLPLYIFALGTVLILSGCSTLNGGSEGTEGVPSPEQAQPVPAYYDFEDVPTPPELAIVPEETHVFQGEKFKAGILMLKGRVEPTSLFDYFKQGMPREGWHLMGSFHSARSVLVFDKAGKFCVINIYETSLTTYAEIYVAPVSADTLSQ